MGKKQNAAHPKNLVRKMNCIALLGLRMIIGVLQRIFTCQSKYCVAKNLLVDAVSVNVTYNGTAFRYIN